MNIQKLLFSYADEKYAQFQKKLIPTLDDSTVIGVRVPALRKLAKELYKSGDYREFIADIPHKYYDENMLHVLIISEFKDFGQCMEETEKFLPYIDNWAACDIFSPRIFKKHKSELLAKIKLWAKGDTYTCRFGIEMLMTFFLDDDFLPEYLNIPASVRSEEYYVNMMIAWFFATALTKQWDDTISYIENKRLGKWVHNKTIQKARESYRITDERKEYLKSLKIN